MAGRTRARSRENRRVIRFVMVVVCLMAVISMSRGYKLYQNRLTYEAEGAKYDILIAEEQAKAEELKAYGEYTKTEEFVAWYAREVLGLVKENEILLKREKK